jgi:glycosyltransferase involved in cell wall biosynthesis
MGVVPLNSNVNFIADDGLLLKELKTCDIFFLPIVSSCNLDREQQAITGFPTKLLDYLLSQRPVLVHSPATYYTALFCRKYGCGYIVEGGVDDIQVALQKLRDGKELRFSLVQNGLETISIFDGVNVANRFRDLLTL